LGNNTRLKIIVRLQYGELCVCEISEIINLSIPATSQQLKMLRQGNILKLRNEGKTAFYSLAKPGIPAIIKNTFTSIFE
jgi:ArsR family transcriptional regulator